MVAKEIAAETHVNNHEFGHRTKRIVSNSFLLFFRMLFVTVINLYAVRFVLKGLGMVDYGVFNAVFGIVMTSSFLILVFSTSIQRFYSYAFGKKDKEMIEELFSASCNILIILSFVILLLLETVGLWYINTCLNIPIDRIYAVNWVFQFASISFLFTLLLVPFTASVFSHEDMGIYALMSCVDYGLRFVVAVLIVTSPIDRLIFYSSGLLVVSIIIFVSYAYIVHKRYEECRYRAVKNRSTYRELLSFSGWTMYGALAGTGMIQGSTLILNFFFGPVANAAFAIANQLYNAFSSLANSIVLSFRPTMIKSYAEENYRYLINLFSTNNKILIYLTGCVAIPIVFEMEFILTHWLDDITPDMVLYSQLFIAYAVLIAMHNPITTIIQSTGRIKKYQLLVQTITLLSLPLAIVMFKFGLPSYYMFVSILFCCVVAHVFRIYCLKELFPDFNVKDYLAHIVIPGAVTISLTVFLTWLIYINISNQIINFVVVFVTSPLILCLLALLIGISKTERVQLIDFVKTNIKR